MARGSLSLPTAIAAAQRTFDPIASSRRAAHGPVGRISPSAEWRRRGPRALPTQLADKPAARAEFLERLPSCRRGLARTVRRQSPDSRKQNVPRSLSISLTRATGPRGDWRMSASDLGLPFQVLIDAAGRLSTQESARRQCDRDQVILKHFASAATRATHSRACIRLSTAKTHFGIDNWTAARDAAAMASVRSQEIWLVAAAWPIVPYRPSAGVFWTAPTSRHIRTKRNPVRRADNLSSGHRLAPCQIVRRPPQAIPRRGSSCGAFEQVEYGGQCLIWRSACIAA